ncbi:YceI family protein [Parapedobacter sp. 10938]|uniref:YceI family protein n=1 Tax=Parapedobacter flavus TaxID=3110225 RepID=UPI002DC0346C|nr:YceI family protein [Parapedobacter sp. 10938]MEC3880541.1 YceI family protein [Parapedobacter sp. 10938]
MIKVYVWFFAMALCFRAEAQGLLIDKASRISFFSEAPLENIAAVTEKAASALDTGRREIAFKVAIKTFAFKKRLMQEHFNENYMESDRFPHATFNGKIQEPVDWRSDGAYPVTVVGTLDIHGVGKRYTIPATITVRGASVTATAKFNVRVADHDVRIPRIVIKNIAEVVEVKVSAAFSK